MPPRKAAAPALPKLAPKKKKPAASRTVLLSHYREAAQQYFNCAPSDFEFAVCWENGPCQVNIGNKVYRIDSLHDLTERAKWLLTDRDGAMEFPIEWAFIVLEAVHRESAFYIHLLADIGSDALKLAQLQTVITVTQSTGDSIETFWEALHAVDDTELYAAAILAASKTYDLDCMIEDAVVYLYGEGEDYLNQLGEGGIFETVVLNEATGDSPTAEEIQKEEYFYLYSVDSACWDEKEIVTEAVL
jgi:hypothetical protein